MTEKGEKLRRLMLKADLSPKEVAAKIHRCRRTVYNFFNGEAGPKTEAQIDRFCSEELRTFAHLD